jgi:hypothetical protein
MITNGHKYQKEEIHSMYFLREVHSNSYELIILLEPKLNVGLAITLRVMQGSEEHVKSYHLDCNQQNQGMLQDK